MHKVSKGVFIMKKQHQSLIIMYLIVLSLLIFAAVIGSKTVTVLSEAAPITNRRCIVIDAGHGGVDGGATSCTGVLESNINLQISLRLNDLCRLLGMDTYMIRTTDCSVYTSGETIAAKKASDLKERVRIINSLNNPVLISIHQNYFSDDRYSGAQVFYANNTCSKQLAEMLQSELVKTLNPGSNRMVKKADGIYLMQHIDCSGVLVECGFLSNPEEEAKLRDESYQKRLCSVIAATILSYAST